MREEYKDVCRIIEEAEMRAAKAQAEAEEARAKAVKAQARASEAMEEAVRAWETAAGAWAKSSEAWKQLSLALGKPIDAEGTEEENEEIIEELTPIEEDYITVGEEPAEALKEVTKAALGTENKAAEEDRKAGSTEETGIRKFIARAEERMIKESRDMMKKSTISSNSLMDMMMIPEEDRKKYKEVLDSVVKD